MSSTRFAALVCLPLSLALPASVCHAAVWSAASSSAHIEDVAARSGAASPGVSGSLQYDDDMPLPGAPLSFYLFKLGAKNIPPPPQYAPRKDTDTEMLPVYDETNWISMMWSSSFTGSD